VKNQLVALVNNLVNKWSIRGQFLQRRR